MSSVGRVTVSLSTDLLREIDRREKNRSKFIADAVRHELIRRRREDLRRSLQNPHPESLTIAEEGFDMWARSLPNEDSDLVDPKAGKAVRWLPGEGWIEDSE